MHHYRIRFIDPTSSVSSNLDLVNTKDNQHNNLACGMKVIVSAEAIEILIT